MVDPSLGAGGILSELAQLPVANIADAQDRLGVVDAAISPVWAGARLAGRAVTVEVAHGDNAGIHEILPDLEPGDVLVVNGHGLVDRALIGGIIGEKLAARGAVGALVDGAVRDVDELRESGIPVFARAVTPAGPYRNGPARLRIPVAIGGVVVATDDLVLGDADGVVVVEAARAATVLAAAVAKNEAEAATRSAIPTQFGR